MIITQLAALLLRFWQIGLGLGLRAEDRPMLSLGRLLDQHGEIVSVVAAACSRVFAYYAVPCTRRRRCCTQTELGAVSPRRVRVSPRQQPQQPLFSGSSSSSSTQEVTLQVGGLPGTEAVAESGGGQRTVRSGRPDLDALVHAAAAAAASSGTSHLVVAACGPPALVAASRTAVAAARKEYRDVHLEFSGGDSRW